MTSRRKTEPGRRARRNSHQRDRLPEVRKVMEHVPRVDEIRRLALVLVREEAGMNDLDVSEARPHGGDHRRRYIDGHDATRNSRSRGREDAGAGAKIDD